MAPHQNDGPPRVGETVSERIDVPTTPEQKTVLEKLSAVQVKIKDRAGEKIQAILNKVPGNGAPIGGLKVMAESGWFAARPSGTENIYMINNGGVISETS